MVAAHSHDRRFRAYRNDTNLGMQENVLKVVREAPNYVFILTDDDLRSLGADEGRPSDPVPS